MGIPLGMFQTVTCVYAIEVMPTHLRAYLTSYVNMCWVSITRLEREGEYLICFQVIGQLIATCVLRGSLNLSSPWAYRVPFAIQ